MLLTSRIVRVARPREHRYVLADEHGMSLHVMPQGSKWWRFRYRFRQTERMISLGVYPSVDLATARRLHADARGLLARDIDPSADRKEKRAASAHTFEAVARQWLKLLEPRVAKGLLAADTLKDATRILERDIFPALDARRSPTSQRTSSCGCSKRLSSRGCGILQDAPSNGAAAYFDMPSAWAIWSGTLPRTYGVCLSHRGFATELASSILPAWENCCVRSTSTPAGKLSVSP